MVKSPPLSGEAPGRQPLVEHCRLGRMVQPDELPILIAQIELPILIAVAVPGV
jgi:hypothetical protein